MPGRAGKLPGMSTPICRWLTIGGHQNNTPTAQVLVDAQDWEDLDRYNWSIGQSGARKVPIAIRGVDLAGRRRTITMHREILGLQQDDHRTVEHINGNRLDNRRANLRIYEPKNPPAPPITQSTAKPDGPCIMVGGNRPRRSGPPSQIFWARVDAEDYERLLPFAWSPINKKGGVTAVRRDPQPDGGYRMVQMHREVMAVDHTNPLVVDHINGDSLDNRKANLRLVTVAENGQNRHKLQLRRNKDGERTRSSQYRGVTFNKQYGEMPWTVQLRFPTEDEAHECVVRWRREHMPFSEMDKD
jgi:hypothetical protein